MDLCSICFQKDDTKKKPKPLQNNLYCACPFIGSLSLGAADQPPIPPGALRRPGPGGEVGPTPVATIAAALPVATPAAPAVTAAAVAPVAASLVTAQTPAVSVTPLPTSTLAQVPAAALVDGTALIAAGDEGTPAAALPAAVTPVSTVAGLRLPVTDVAALPGSVPVPVPAPVATPAVTPVRYTGDMGARAPSAVRSSSAYVTMHGGSQTGDRLYSTPT